MKKTISILIISVLLLSFAACGKPSESSLNSASEQQSVSESPQERESVIPAQYTSLVQLCNTIAKPGLYWQCQLPGVEYDRKHVAVTKELQDEIYKILTENESLLQPDMQDDDSRDMAGGAIILDLWASDDGLYPNSDQLVFVVIYPLGKNDPAAPNSTFLSISNIEEHYTYPTEVYDKLLPLLQANTVETHADLEGEYIRMTLSQTEIYPVWGETLECENALIHSSYAYSDDNTLPKTKWQLEALDLNTGKSLYCIESSNFEDRGAMLRISALSDVPDYDYVMFFENGYAYKKSKGSSQEVYFALPGEVKPMPDIFGDATSYDEYGDYIVWVDSDGIYLRIAKQDGITQNLVLPNTELSPAMFSKPDAMNDLVCTAPRFICGGKKVASMIRSESLFDDVGAIVFDIASGNISSTFSYFQPNTVEYPITDRYIVTRGMGSDAKMLDAETGEVTEIPAFWIGRSYDYKTYIVQDYSTLDARNAPSYVCEANDLEDRSRSLLRSYEPHAWINLPEATEHYAIFNVTDFEGNWLAAAKYR